MSFVSHWLLDPLVLLSPMYVANAVPILISKWNFLNVPIDAGKTYRGKRFFGSHKTWRGFVFGTLFGTLAGMLLLNSVAVGFVLSIFTLLGDLLGAFAKRQSGIAPGKKAFLYDRVIDYFLPVLAVLIFGLIELTLSQIIFIYFVTIVLHRVANIIYFKLKIKSNPW